MSVCRMDCQPSYESDGLTPVFDVPLSTNPLPWTNHWLNSKGQQNAPQETEIESYIVGGIKQDVGKKPSQDFHFKFQHHWEVSLVMCRDSRTGVRNKGIFRWVLLNFALPWYAQWWLEWKVDKTMSMLINN